MFLILILGGAQKTNFVKFNRFLFIQRVLISYVHSCTVIQTTSIYWVKAVHAQVSPCSSAARATLTFMASVGVLLAYVL